MQLASNLGISFQARNKKTPSSNPSNQIYSPNQANTIAQKDVFFSGTGKSTNTQDARAVAKAEAKNKQLFSWSKMAIKYSFKTGFEILKSCFSWQDIKNGASHLKEVLTNIPQQMESIMHHIPIYIQHGWEVAKEHIIPHMHQIVQGAVEFIRRGLEHFVSFTGSAKQITKPQGLRFQGGGGINTNPQQNLAPSTQPNAIKPLELTPVQEAMLESNLELAEEKFEMLANKKNDTPAQRQVNIQKYGTEVFNALYTSLLQSQPGLQQTVAKDVHKIVNELNAIAPEVAQKQTFGQLREATQDRMIDLIQFSLKHPEPRISGFGNDLAQSLGLSQTTIQALREE